MNDKELRQAVLAELEFEPMVDAKHIGVTAENRIITLTGHVSSYIKKLMSSTQRRKFAGFALSPMKLR